MPKKNKKREDKKVQETNFQIRGVELVSAVINAPPAGMPPQQVLNYHTKLQSMADVHTKNLVIAVIVSITDSDVKFEFASFVINCFFYIENYDEVVTIEDSKKVIVPVPFLNALNAISISTARGMMAALTKGTHLHNAVLPIIDANKLGTVPHDYSKD